MDLALQFGLSDIRRKTMLEFIILGGVGIPLQTRTESDGGPVRRDSESYLDNLLPFIGIDLPFSYKLNKHQSHGWYLTLKPFFRGHFNPLYSIEFSEKDIYLNYGISLGIQLKRK